jgi:hypothetical protein
MFGASKIIRKVDRKHIGIIKITCETYNQYVQDTFIVANLKIGNKTTN